MTYRAPIRDLAFALETTPGMEALTAAFPDYDADTARAVLEAAGQMSAELLAPLNTVGDRRHPVLKDDQVTASPGFAVT